MLSFRGLPQTCQYISMLKLSLKMQPHLQWGSRRLPEGFDGACLVIQIPKLTSAQSISRRNTIPSRPWPIATWASVSMSRSWWQFCRSIRRGAEPLDQIFNLSALRCTAAAEARVRGESYGDGNCKRRDGFWGRMFEQALCENVVRWGASHSPNVRPWTSTRTDPTAASLDSYLYHSSNTDKLDSMQLDPMTSVSLDKSLQLASYG
ncbi:hypothetical protein BCR34DRAFT_106444 [Clohesyomyces aquaticus]|uniref:Uncharacterized protein n=1 Tax=Clohesyomyces aquaticus TaxID=1231657 RepID=A0A1Y2A2B8_9PLEO|nr:hypothetical protein BCR34DRAFT_106444 [Clohesyomyces aquaticus]